MKSHPPRKMPMPAVRSCKLINSLYIAYFTEHKTFRDHLYLGQPLPYFRVQAKTNFETFAPPSFLQNKDQTLNGFLLFLLLFLFIYRMPASEVDVSVAKDGGIMKTISRQGEGQVTPEFGSEVISRSFFRDCKVGCVFPMVIWSELRTGQ